MRHYAAMPYDALPGFMAELAERKGVSALALRVALDGLERHRASIWQPGKGQDRGMVAVGLLVVLAASRINAELEAVDWEGEAKKVLRNLRLISELVNSAVEFGDKQSVDLLSALYERFDAHFPDEARLWRRAQLHDKTSRNKAGLRERLMALDLHKYLKRILGRLFTNLIAQLLWETTGREIDAKQVGRWISAYERRKPDLARHFPSLSVHGIISPSRRIEQDQCVSQQGNMPKMEVQE